MRKNKKSHVPESGLSWDMVKIDAQGLTLYLSRSRIIANRDFKKRVPSRHKLCATTRRSDWTSCWTGIASCNWPNQFLYSLWLELRTSTIFSEDSWIRVVEAVCNSSSRRHWVCASRDTASIRELDCSTWRDSHSANCWPRSRELCSNLCSASRLVARWSRRLAQARIIRMEDV